MLTSSGIDLALCCIVVILANVMHAWMQHFQNSANWWFTDEWISNQYWPRSALFCGLISV